MFKSNSFFALMVAALALALGLGLMATKSYAGIPEQASAQLERVTPAR